MDTQVENGINENIPLDDKEVIEQSTTSKTLLTGILIFASIIVLGLIFMPKPVKHYQISEEKMLDRIIKGEGIAGPEVIVNLIYNPDSQYRFIDLRSAPEYLKGHLPNAINIPINHIFDKQYEKIWKDDGKTNLLYYSDHAGACGPWMILNQTGYKNTKIVLGGYNYVNEYIINSYGPLTGKHRDEKANYDFAKIVSQTSGGGGVNASVTDGDKPAGVPVVKKKKEGKSGGGC
jgi:rhodanese-related sulfurtransferase